MAEQDAAKAIMAFPALRATQCHLPPELIHAVIGYIYSRWDLTSCSLVCRSWAEVAFPMIHSCIKFPPSSNYRRAFNDGRILLRWAKELSSFMRSCVKHAIFVLSSETCLTSQMLAEALGLFPNLKELELTEADLSDEDEDEEEELQPLQDPTPAEFTPPKQKPSISVLRPFCNIDLLDCDRRRQPSPALSNSGPPPDSISSSSILFHFLGIFHEIEELDLLGFSIGQDARAPDPELAKQLPRIRTVVNSFYDGTSVSGYTAASIVCRHLDPALPIGVRDVTFTFAFLSRHPNLSYPNITHFSGRFGFHNTRFQISITQLPSLVKLELYTRKSITPHDAQVQTHPFWGTDPLEVFADGFHHAPLSLRHVTLEIDLCSDLNHVLNHRSSLSLEDAIIPQLGTMDWSALRRLFDSKKDVWVSQAIVFTVQQQVTVFTKVGRREITVSVKQLEEALRKEFPILGSSYVSFAVKLSPPSW